MSRVSGDRRGRRGRLALAGLVALGALLASASFGGSGVRAGGPAFHGELVGTFVRPTHVTAEPSHPDLLYVVEQRGTVVALRDERRLSERFLDIRDIVLAQNDPGGGTEQGLLSIAFPPDHADSGLFYVFFTNGDGDIEVDEFERSAADPAVADPASRRTVIVIPHRDAQNHNGGQLQFGPGGFLFFATGDGGASTRLRGIHARDPESLLGKLIRIDPRRRGARPYRSPNTNPYVGVAGRDEIYSYGLRNPYRFSFEGNRLALGDVGQVSREEVNVLGAGQARGANFGWPEYEGDLLWAPDLPGADPPTFPMHVYSHDSGGCAVIGGYVVRDPGLPALGGRYLYGDFCLGQLRSFVPNVALQEARGDAPLGVAAPQLNTFGQGVGGQIYYALLSGEVFRLEAGPGT